ncbi:hypothetical protein JX265_002870 [Neoarthrinium moseri]|uniref:3-carboxymuconate cyclase n=1 Tax=Neoarthrinium moseri TaxID=1658444 RepID=A0A9Q0APQ3_9PEZI|nr:hypothetical protein JX265_002870 [Neoarthrinium moseri]
MRASGIYLLSLSSLVLGAAVRRSSSNGTGGALYLLENNPAGANIVSLGINSDGTLGAPVRTSTGGTGLVGTGNQGPVQVDSLFSQDAVHVAGEHLFTVNAGSSSIAYFHIPPNDPTHPVLVGEPASTRGDVPNSVAYSPKHKLVCATNTGPRAGVSCFSITENGLTPSGAFMPLPLNQTSPPTGPPNTFSDIVFNPAQTTLFVTLKGDGVNPGSIFAFPVSGAGVVSPKPRVSRPAELLTDFAMSFINDTHAFVADPAYGGSFVRVGCGLDVSVTRKVTIPGQVAACWSRYDARRDEVLVFDAGVSDITAVAAQSGEIARNITGVAEAMGQFDAVLRGDRLYVLENAPGIGVYALAGANGTSILQNFDLSAFGKRQFFQGLAIYPSA